MKPLTEEAHSVFSSNIFDRIYAQMTLFFTRFVMMMIMDEYSPLFEWHTPENDVQKRKTQWKMNKKKQKNLAARDESRRRKTEELRNQTELNFLSLSSSWSYVKWVYQSLTTIACNMFKPIVEFLWTKTQLWLAKLNIIDAFFQALWFIMACLPAV